MILKRLSIYLFLILSVSACHDMEKPKKPDNLIPKDKMVDILIDAKLISSASSVNRKIMEDRGVKLNQYVFEKHNIDSLQFVLSNEYYAFYIKDYQEIYDKIKDSLKVLKEKFKKEEEEFLKEKEERHKDSIKKIKERDSLTLINGASKFELMKDSLNEKVIHKKLEEERTLIEPISDRTRQ